jgi:hypothetical protein
LETFTVLKEFVDNPDYQDQKQKILAGLSDAMVDAPIIDLIQGFNRLSYCFTIQCCYGHFVHEAQTDPHNLEPLPMNHTIDSVEYRIAYVCLCIDNSKRGRTLRNALNEIPAIDPQNIQFGCAEWFWKRQVNSYALQVQPDRFKQRDNAILEYREALHIQKIRNEFFAFLQELN